MDDIIAVAVTTDREAVCYFITWGRVQDVVDPEPTRRLWTGASRLFVAAGRPVSHPYNRLFGEVTPGPTTTL